jgi:DivIVA domain-containing protein
MGVVFALIGLAVIGAGVVILLKFTGAGEVADPVHDRAVAAMPTGPIGSTDLRRVRFPVAFRGYRMDDVDALLDRLAEQLEPPVQAAAEPGLGLPGAELAGPESGAPAELGAP